MIHVIYAIQIAVVFLVPSAFGWVLLRRIVGEMDPAILLPGAVVGGLISLAALVNELRIGLEMSTALWSAYKLLIAATLLTVIFGPRPRGRVGWAGSSRRIWPMALVLAAAALVAVYFGVPAFRYYLSDAWWGHYPIGVQIQTAARFPLPPPFAPDDMLLYHIGPDIIAASLSFLLHLPIERGYAVLIVVFAPATFLLTFGLVQRLARNYWSGFFAACFMLLGGNLRFLRLLTHWPRDVAHGLEVFNSQTIQGLLQMIFTPSHSVGVPIVLLSLAILRHFVARPSWALGTLLGLLVGSITLAAEWYFYPLWGALAAGLALRCWQMRARPRGALPRRAGLLLAVALAVAFFNNTYAAGLFQEYWLPRENYGSRFAARMETAHLEGPGPSATHLPVPSVSVASIIPVRLNLQHFGEVPSWEAAGSGGGSWISLFGGRFLSELLPIVGVGLPFGWWWWRRNRSPVLLVVVLLATISLMPPILLEWGFRPADFLRFLTGAFAFAAIPAGALVGFLLTSVHRGRRWFGAILGACALANAAGLGILGLLPGTVELAKATSSAGRSLSQVADRPSVPPDSASTHERDEAFQALAGQLDRFLFPLAHGRDRVIVIVDPREVPPLKEFPEWMKLAAMSRLLLPVGWHWTDSGYAQYYRIAARTLEPDAVTALRARWVVATNLWNYLPQGPAAAALHDSSRFVPAATFHSGSYSLSLYHIR